MFSFSLYFCISLSSSLGSHISCSITTLVGIALFCLIYRLLERAYSLTCCFSHFPCMSLILCVSVCVSLWGLIETDAWRVQLAKLCFQWIYNLPIWCILCLLFFSCPLSLCLFTSLKHSLTLSWVTYKCLHGVHRVHLWICSPSWCPISLSQMLLILYIYIMASVTMGPLLLCLQVCMCWGICSGEKKACVSSELSQLNHQYKRLIISDSVIKC